MPAPKTVLITPSFSRDLERCRRTVESVERFVDPAVHHYLIIDRRDLPLFRPLEGPRTTVVTAEDLLPRWLVRLPGARKWWLSLRTLPVRNWIVQQIMKLAVAEHLEADVYCFVDSDVTFVRPLDAARLHDDTRGTRLFRSPGLADLPTHHRWHRTASRLLGLPETDYFGADYIGNLITWRRDHLLGLYRHIEDTTGRPWARAVAAQAHLSEYILYGVYVEHVLGLASSGHAPSDRDLCLCSWHFPMDTPEGQKSFLAALEPEHVAVLVQSNLGLDETQTEALVRSVEERAGAGV